MPRRMTDVRRPLREEIIEDRCLHGDYRDHDLWRILGLAQEGASFIAECLRAAARIIPGDPESWYNEWNSLGKASKARAELAKNDGNIRSAGEFWLRASSYHRSSEVRLLPNDPRGKKALKQMGLCSRSYLQTLCPRGELVQIQAPNGKITGYFLPGATGKSPVVICLGGPGELKDDQLYRTRRHALIRGMSLLLIDFEGGKVRRGRSAGVYPASAISCCIDYLENRTDVEMSQIALLGTGLGAAYAWSAANMDERLRAVVCDGGLWELRERVYSLDWMAGMVRSHTVSELMELGPRGSARGIKLPLLVTMGAQDFLGVRESEALLAKKKWRALRLDFKLFSKDETGALPGHIDNPTLTSEFIFDWISRKFAEIRLNSPIKLQIPNAKRPFRAALTRS